MSTAASTGMRFYTSGVELVRKTFDELGQSGQKMWAGIASGHTKASPAMRGLNQASKEVQDGVAGVAANAGAAGSILSKMGPAGIAAAAGIGGVVLALHETKKAMEDLGGLGETAARIGVTTDALQKWRFVVEQTGGTVLDADAALKSFAENFGGARSGSKRQLRYFEALGLSQDDLKQFKSASDLLPVVTAKIAALKSQDSQLFISGKLGIQAFLPAIREGQDSIDAMMRTAQEMGLVVGAKIIATAKEAGDKYKLLSSIIDTQLKKAFIDLVPVLLAIVGVFADMARWMGRIIDQTKTLENRTIEGLQHRMAQLGQNNADMIGKYGIIPLQEKVQGPSTPPRYDEFNHRVIPAQYSDLDEARMQFQKNLAEINRIRTELVSREAASATTPGQTGNGSLGDLGTDEIKQRDDRFASDIKRAHERYLAALEKEVMSIEARLDLQLRGLEDEKNLRTAELARQVKDKALTQSQADQIAAEEQKARNAQADQLRDRARREKLQSAAQYDGETADMALELLRIQGEMEVTVEGRYRIQKQLLEAERAQARKELEKRLGDNPNLSSEQKQAELGKFDQVTKVQVGALNEQNNGVRSMFRDAFRSGIQDALRSGNPFDLLKGFFSSLADSFANRLSDRLADELFNLFDSLISDLTGSIGGGAGGGIFDTVAGAIGSLFGAGHAPGGPTRAGTIYPINERGIELFQSGGNGYVLNHGQAVSAMAAEIAAAISHGGGSRPVSVTVRQEPGVAVEYVGHSDEQIEMIARRVVHKEAPRVVAADISSSRNSVTSKAVRLGTGVK